MDKLLTEANWKKEGLPLRTKMEALKKRKTGVSEALRTFEKADKELMADKFSNAAARDTEKALQALLKALNSLQASDPKLKKLVKSMADAANSYAKDFNNWVCKLERDDLDGIPGALKAWKEFAKSEFTYENEEFYTGTSRAPTGGEGWIELYEKYIKSGDLNINNLEAWDKLAALWLKSEGNPSLRAKIEKEFQKELHKSRDTVLATMADSVNRLKDRQEIHL